MTDRNSIHIGYGETIDIAELSPELIQDLADCTTAGDCSEAVDYVMNTYPVSGDPEFVRDYVRSFGGWIDDDSNPDDDLARAIWIAASQLFEFETYTFEC